MQCHSFAKRLSSSSRNLISILCCFLIITAAWLGVCLDNSMALAEPEGVSLVDAMDGTIANQHIAFNEVKSRIKDDLRDFSVKSRSAGEAEVSDSQESLEYDEVSKRAEKAGAAVDGRSRETVAKVQGEATDSEHKVNDAIEDVMNNIRETVR
jgi:hypothetical protein